MKIARPIAFLFIMTLVFALLHASSFEVFAQTECVQPLDSVAVEGTWNDDCLSRNREDAYARYYTFSILRQFDVSITLESETDPYVFLLSGTGADADYLAENDDIDTGGRNFNSRVAITLEPGDYTIEATTYEQPAVGDFTLTVRGVGPLDDRAALAVLYNATDGPNWSDNTNWLTDVPLGEWQGVTTNDDGRVTELVFEGINLSGQIPSEIGNLSELEKLIFLDNELTGEIPTELGKLTRLKLLDLGSNEFTGSIPIDLSSLTKLQRLWLDNNRLTGTIPPELGDLPSLEEIYLSGNQLTGCVPVSLEDALEDFDELGLPLCNDADTTPTLPACVEALPETTTVAGTWNTDCTSNISAPQGRGDRYARFYAFTLNEAATVTVTLESSADTYLYLRKGLGRDETELLCENDDYSTPVNGTSCSNIDFNLNAQYDSGILASLGAGTYTIESTTYAAGTTGDFTLTTAGIDFTKPDASDRAALTALYNATNGDNWTHSDNWLTDALLSEWHGVYTNEDGRVTELDLNFNNLTGTLSPELVNLSELQALNLQANMGLTGTISPQLGSIANLRDLRLNDCNLTGEIPSELGNLTNLRFLFLQANQLKGQIPPELGDITNLQVLSLWHNQLSGEIPPELGSLSNLQELWLHDNVLTGEIPSELARLDNLELLYLKYNRLTGAIPPQFGNLTNLRELWLHNNGLVSDGLSGEIPPELGNLANLQELLLHDNVLTGEIPPELGNLANLQELSLGGNHLTGAIPVELSRLSKLKSLSLGGNQLTGKIPSQLGDIETLEFISLWQNNLTGEIPPELGKVTNLGGLDLQYNQLTGNVPAEIGNLVNLWSTLDLRGNQLTGKLPHSLTNINDLFNFNFDANAGLCAPADATFQAWLQSIPQHEGPNCEDATPDPTPDDPISPIPSGCTMQTFNGTSVDDSWTSDCVSRNRTENGTHYAKFFSFSVSRSATYDITLESPTDPYLILLGESGVIIDDDDDDDDGIFDLRARSSGIRIPLDPGDYIVEATTYAGTATGDFTLTIIRPELAALHAFYNATDGENWRQSENWLTDAPLSQWHGVTTDSDGRVTILELEHNHLSGKIPPEIGSLSNLVTLNLGGNDLSGELPAELGELEDLVTLDFWGNAFTGEIPPELGKLANLKTLYLLANELTGEIPAELGNLSRLEVLHIGENQLTGTIPTQLGSLSSLRSLTLNDNELTGEIPSELGELWELNRLWLYENQLTGEIPPELGNLTGLTEFHLYENQLAGQIPVELSNLTDLTQLHLRDNHLTGEIPAELGNLTKLRYIFLSNNRLEGQIPRELANLPSLDALGLGGNNLTGEIPPELADIKTLGALWLQDNSLTAQSFLPRLKEIVNLGVLDIGGNQIAGADVLPQIAALTELRALGLQDSQLSTDQLTPHLESLSGLTMLYLGDNRLTGDHLLTRLANLNNLHTLDVHNNQLTGTIPPELGTGTGSSAFNKSYLDLSYNQLTGQVPPELGNADDLEYLDLSNNRLTNQIPSNLTELIRLETFRFHNNAGLCAPNDDEFQEWLRLIVRVEGPTCDDTQPDPPELPECVEPLPDEGAVNAIWSTGCTSDIDAPSGRGNRYARFYTFTLYAASDVTITLSSKEDTFLYLRSGTSTDGAALYENDDYNYPDSTDSRVEETLEAGTYTIEATTYTAGITGDFVLTIKGIGPLDDRAALIALYNATDGDDWEDNDNWLTDAPLDEWNGVETDVNGRVIILDLAGNDLAGHIPPELGELSELEVLELDGNLLTGTLPPELGKLSELEHLELGDNLLTGTLPPELGKLSELEYLELGGNLLTGTLPPELGKLVKLTDFSVEANYLTGTIPPEIGNLASLEIIRLNGNRFWGELPHSLTALNRLRRLEYEDNSGLCAPADAEFQKWLNSVARVRGDTCVRPDSPPDEREIAALTAIYNATGGDDWFDRTNWFSDEPVQFWSGISVNGEGHITELRLWGNNLSGQIPTELSHLTSLKRLYLRGNYLTGTIPEEIGSLTELEDLLLDDNQLTGNIPPELGNLTTLKLLYLDKNKLTGSVPPELGKLTYLESLEIDDNRLTGQLPYELTNLVVLETLYFNGNDGLCAPGTAAFQDWLKSIAQVRGDTCVSGSEEADRAALTALYNATGGDNWFNNTNWLTDAPLDEWHGVYTDSEGHVVSLYLGHNSLSGAVPPEIGGLINLSQLGLGFNQLTGTLPPELGNLTRLEFLDLSYNRLWGELPRSMTALTQLISLYSLGNSGLCAPPDAEFQEWLEAIPSGSVWVITCNPPSTRPDAGDLAVLTALYNATDGANWDDNTNWLSERPLQYWKGVTINSEGRVIQLDLFSNQLSGDIPVELANLADLEWLYLHQNQLSGDIPAELGNLISLERLSLGGNQLSGDIPVTLGGLTYLEVLDLSDNQLSGVIPPELASLTELWTLTLDRNQLSGDVPVELGNLISLKWLSLYNNQLTGDIPATLGRPTYLEMLDLSDNKLTGAIPPELANLTELRSLHLGANQLTGEIPDWIDSLDQLAVLALYDNQLTGAIPPELANLTEMSSLSLGGNRLTGEIPNWLGGLDQLVFLSVNDNQLTGAIPPELGSLYQLFYLLLDNNQLTGTIPPELGNLHQLGTLWLHNNRLTGTIPPELSNLIHSLEELLLAGNQLTGCIPQVLRGVGTNDLDELGLPFCENTDLEALIAFYNATDGDHWHDSTNWLSEQPLQYWKGVHINEEGRVVELRLGGNNLSGQIPPELGNLSKLEHLSIQYNQLTGSIPSRLSNLTELTSLSLNGNRLTGPIPSEWGNLLELVELRLNNNQLTGTIPPELGSPPNLGELFLANNQLTGCIPFTLSDIPANDFTQLDLPFCDNPDRAILVALYHATNGDNWNNNTNWLTDAPLHKWYGVDTDNGWNVHILSLSDNQLTGQLPPELGELHFVKGLYFDNNQLTGHIPLELGNLSKNLVALWLHSNQFSGTIPPELGNLDKLYGLNISGNQLTGKLPDELTELRELYSLLFDNNAGLCAPTDAVFQQWLQSIDNIEGPTCTDNTPAPTPGDPIPSECVNSLGGTPAEGTWTADCLSINRTENGVHYARYYSFTLDRRSQVDLTLESSTDPYLILLSETGEVLAQDDDDDKGVFDLTSRSSGIRIVLEAGDYIVEATTCAGTAADDFTLTFRRPELEALQSLYNFTNGDSWDNSENWLTDAPFAEWYGIQTDDEGRVIGIYLSDNNLKGELPPELGRLSQLEWLGLANNELSGLIPPELGDLYNLRILVLLNNDLTGPIPYQLGKLQELLEMYLEGNRLSGPIPAQLGDLRKLYFLNLTDNELSGDIPSSLGNLQELRDLHIAANDLSGPIPRELGDLSKLKRLDIRDNDLTGGDFIDLRLDDLDDLSFLDIGGNRIDGRDVLFQVHELFHLRGLGLHDSGLTDSELRDYMEIIRERDLRFFDISSNELSDPQILEGLSRMSTLSYLHINDNDFSGELPQAMIGLSDMRRFHFRDNDGLRSHEQ